MISAAKYAKAAKQLPAIRGFREEKGADGKYIVIGEKARVSLRSMGELERVVASVADVGRNEPTFADCAAIAQVALENEWNGGVIMYNFHKSAMTQEIEQVPVASVAGLEAAPGITQYDSVDEDVIQSFSEFALAASLYGCLKENYASEQAARMIAMDGATKNAGEMIDKMTLQFNRLRQAVITTELCEIIAGMSAL